MVHRSVRRCFFRAEASGEPSRSTAIVRAAAGVAPTAAALVDAADDALITAPSRGGGRTKRGGAGNHPLDRAPYRVRMARVLAVQAT